MLSWAVRVLTLVALLSLAVAESPEEVAILDDADLGEAAGLGEAGDGATQQLAAKLAVSKKPGPLKVLNSKAFSVIPNFVVPGTKVNVKSRLACMEKCHFRKECRSFSYRKRDKQCYWSTGSVRYDAAWKFFSKEYDLDAFGKMSPTSGYNKFNGLYAIDEDRNMKTKTGKSLKECKDDCNADRKCLSFSWNEHDHACLMGLSKVEYKEGWTYYERNKEPAKKNGRWLPYPLRLDAYHREQRREEMKTLRLFAERDKKARIRREKKKEILDKKMKYMEKKRKRLDQEMKVKGFAREQRHKKYASKKKQQQVDMDAAREKGKFDEAFHKQTLKNKELLHKRKMEARTKAAVKEKKKKYVANADKRFAAHMVKVKARGQKEITMKNDVIRGKERKVKEKRQMGAVEMRNDAFKLVLDERKYKSSLKTNARVKKLKKSNNESKQKVWKVVDMKNKALAGELETKRKIKMAKNERKVKVDLAKEKLGKKPPKGQRAPTSNKQPTLPRVKTQKSKALPKRAPGAKTTPMDAARKATSSKPK